MRFSLLAIAVLAPASLLGQASMAGCPVFPADHILNTPIDKAPRHGLSSTWIRVIGATTTLHPDFGSGTYAGGPIGIPFTFATAATPKVPISFRYSSESDPGPYPIPVGAPVEGGPSATGDRHVLVLNSSDCKLYEVFSGYPQPAGNWTAGSGAVFDLRSNALRPSGWTSADAAGLSILAGLIRYEEVAAGEIRHAIRFTARYTRRQFIWPARHYASSRTGTAYPPMGARFRLKASFSEAGFSRDVQVIIRAMKKYGIILADNGSPWYLSGAPDPRWNNTVLRELKTIAGSNFEAVDTSSYMVNANSGQAKVPGATPAAPAPPPPGSNNGRALVSSSASGYSGGLAPGMLVTVSSDAITGEKSEVTFNGQAGEILYSAPGEVGVRVPEGISASNVEMKVVEGGEVKSSEEFAATESAPGIFGVANAGSEANREDSPAAAGSTIQVLGTGEGTAVEIRIEIDGTPLEIVSSGPAADIAPGVFRVTAKLPEGLSPGAHSLVWFSSGNGSPAGEIFTSAKQ